MLSQTRFTEQVFSKPSHKQNEDMEIDTDSDTELSVETNITAPNSYPKKTPLQMI